MTTVLFQRTLFALGELRYTGLCLFRSGVYTCFSKLPLKAGSDDDAACDPLAGLGAFGQRLFQKSPLNCGVCVCVCVAHTNRYSAFKSLKVNLKKKNARGNTKPRQATRARGRRDALASQVFTLLCFFKN